MSQPFTLGVNYWPRRKAMYWWSNFDAGEVREEFSLIKEIGLNVVRLFLLWDDFQPDPASVAKDKIENLVKVADIAAEHGLGLDITFFTGHMSGPNWSPRWLLGGDLPPKAHNWIRDIVSEGKKTDKGYRNMFHDEMALNATRLLLKTVVTTLKDHPAVWMWNLGNEPDLFAWPNSSDEGAAWVKEMVGLIKSIDPNHPVTIGLHGDGLHRDNGLRIDKVYAHTDVAVMHSYPMYTPWARQPLDPDFVPFTCALTAALAGKPVLMEEFGGCTALPGETTYTMKWTETNGREREQFMASEEDFAEFLRLTIPKLQHSGATGAMLWCYADYVPELWDMPPCQNSQHERFFGLVRPDGSLKPHARVIQEFAKTNPQVLPIPDYAKLTVDADEFYKEPLPHLVDLYQKYLTDLSK
ncbi:MAG TPA: cellulase family glycosylhydrolase [Anaerolineales bacterium]|nr:cellulase family glycosylhydrolase [Anaerolineales bacterium]HMX18546.1 cellulase family glycosylhydrolase [Anaerolineales bacterium]HMX73319.1 cellulase family glycosylhydrolase [Anaerolineales bacterium]HMZ41436.1 cellulase family glycosylhydrolase [Anaerolineales bacterium]HNA53948.1 cellulase family glycosylhydrolase [Anaerolineales bacterium]